MWTFTDAVKVIVVSLYIIDLIVMVLIGRFLKEDWAQRIFQLFDRLEFTFEFGQSCLEMVFVWGITLLKEVLPKEQPDLAFGVLILSFYFHIFAYSKLLYVRNDFGILNGITSIGILVFKKQFFLAVPLMATTLTWKKIMAWYDNGAKVADTPRSIAALDSGN